jgi:glycosyltransferase involved in cell wall biosynthesis
MKLRILYCLSGLDVGGVELWLCDIVRELRGSGSQEVHCDFMTLLKSQGELQPELERLGCRILHAGLVLQHPVRSVLRMRRIMRAGGYSVVHCQSDHISGLVLLAAFMARIPRRFFHIHNTRFRLGTGATLRRRVLGVLFRGAAGAFSTASFSCAKTARNAFYGAVWPASAKVLYCGIDTRPFEAGVVAARASVREELGVPKEQQIILSVGRAVEPKNLTFLCEVASELAKREDAVILHAGDGPQRAEIEALVRARRLECSFRVLGRRTDVPRLMLAADAFVMTSKQEGLPLALIQAQAAGLPIVVSDIVTDECATIAELFHWLSLSSGAELWADKLVEVLHGSRPLSQGEALKRIVASPFSISASARHLLNEYTAPT